MMVTDKNLKNWIYLKINHILQQLKNINLKNHSMLIDLNQNS